MNRPEQLLTVREAAARLGCAEAAVRRLVERRQLHAARRTPRLLIRPAEIERYLARGGPAPPFPDYAPAPPLGWDGELLYAIAVATAGEARIERILAATLEQLGRVIDFTGGSIALVEGDELVIRAAVGPFASTAIGLRQPRGAGLGWQVVSTGQPHLSHDLIAEGRRPSSGFRSYLAVPLSWRGAVIGMLEIDSTLPGAFTARDMQLLRRIALALSGSVELARLYGEERRARAEAEAAVRTRDQFLSIAAHELKTPLTPLLGHAQLLERRAAREGQLAERDRRSLQMIAQQVRRLDQLVSSMLDLNRLQTGHLRLAPAPLDIRELARQIADELQPTLELHLIELDLPAEPVVADVDALRLGQVLQNLLSNAVKYSPAGGPVRVEVGRGDGEVYVRVRDAGIGIPAAALPRLFEPFFRADNAARSVATGLGIGLAVVREIVGLHGGSVRVDSAEGRGSSFTVSLPSGPR